MRAAPRLSIFTVADPMEIMPGPAGTQLGSEQGADMSVCRAAGLFSIMVEVDPGGMIASGSAGCATGVGVGNAG